MPLETCYDRDHDGEKGHKNNTVARCPWPHLLCVSYVGHAVPLSPSSLHEMPESHSSPVQCDLAAIANEEGFDHAARLKRCRLGFTLGVAATFSVGRCVVEPIKCVVVFSGHSRQRDFTYIIREFGPRAFRPGVRIALATVSQPHLEELARTHRGAICALIVFPILCIKSV